MSAIAEDEPKDRAVRGQQEHAILLALFIYAALGGIGGGLAHEPLLVSLWSSVAHRRSVPSREKRMEEEEHKATISSSNYVPVEVVGAEETLNDVVLLDWLGLQGRVGGGRGGVDIEADGTVASRVIIDAEPLGQPLARLSNA
jgi:hypothetical protein